MDIAVWLRDLGLERYEQAFQENEIGRDVLSELTAEDLKEIGVIPVGDRRRLLRAIAALAHERESTPPPAGHPDPSPKPTEAERRQLTVMFVDLVGSTALSVQLDPEDMGALIRAYQTRCAEVVKRWEGHVAKYLGDGVLAYFGFPVAHEDDAERAVHAGLELVDAVAEIAAASHPLAVRVGIATGLVVVGELIGEGAAQEEAVVGETPNLAARLQTFAPTGGVVIAPTTRRLVGDLFELEDLGTHDLKGFAQPVAVFRVVAQGTAESRFDAVRGTMLGPLVGREHELGLVLDRWRRARDGDGQVVLLSGEAGIGKSRLVRALRERLGTEPYTALPHYGSPFHTNSTLHPVIGLIERAAGRAREDSPAIELAKVEALLGRATQDLSGAVPLIAALLGIDSGSKYPPPDLTPQRRKQLTMEVLLEQVAGLAHGRPVLVLFEDAHWFDPTTLEWLDILIERTRELPVLTLITFRPEFTPPWTGHAHATQLSLTRLGRREGAEVVERITIGKPLPESILTEILERTDGVPLFVEELTKTVLESGILRDAGDHFELDGPLGPLAIPTTLHDSLMSRLDRLAAVKEIAQIGAVIGRVFPHTLLAAVAERPAAELEDALDQLLAAELIFRRGDPPAVTYLFKHALVRDAAYESLLKSRRQHLHARIATVLEERSPSDTPEIIAHHLTEGGLVEKAISHWQLAGRQATERSAPVEAAAHLTSALELIAGLPESTARAGRELQLHLDLAPALIATGGYRGPGVEETYRRAQQLSREVGEAAQSFTVAFGLWLVHQTGVELAQGRGMVDELLALADEQSDPEFQLEAHHAAWTTLSCVPELSACRQHAVLGLQIYDRQQHRAHRFAYAGHDPGVCASNHMALTGWLLGYPDQAAVAAQQGVALARELEHAPSLVISLSFAAFTHQFRGEAEVVLRLADELIALCIEQGISPQHHAYGMIVRGWANAVGGDVDGVNNMRAGLSKVEATGVRLRQPYLLGLFADACIRSGLIDEAGKALETAFANDERWWEPELLRLRGNLCLQDDVGTALEAERRFQRAL